MLLRERHYTVRELCEIWSRDKWKKKWCTVRRWFRYEPGVINNGNGKNVFLEIPESVAQRVYERHQVNR
jgi:hypothetical protein